MPMRLLFAKKMNECPQCASSRVRRSYGRGFSNAACFDSCFYGLTAAMRVMCDSWDFAVSMP